MTYLDAPTIALRTSSGLRAEATTWGRFALRLAASFVLSVSALLGAVPQARMDPRPIRLPMIDGKGLRFTRISTVDGLSQTRVAQIVQDDRGFMWFGTQYGLNRYDGYKFKVFAHDPRRADSLDGVFISSLFKDRSGALWIGCDQLLDRFDPVTESFTHYRVESEDPDRLAGTVVHISQDRAGMLWLATGTGLHRLDPSTGRIRHYRHDPNEASSLSSDNVNWTGEDREGTFWVGTKQGLDAFDRETGKTTLHIPLTAGVQISFYEDRFGVFWILCTSGSGLAVLDRKTNQVTRYSFFEQERPSGALTGVMAMLEDRHGNLWLGSQGVGLLRFDRQGRKFIRYRNNPGDQESLAEDKVISLYEDREGNIWTGSHSKGPNHFAPTPALFEKFHHDPGNPNSLMIDFVNAIFEDHDGVLWIGNDNGLTRINRKSGEYSFFDAGLGLKPTVITITEDHRGTLWVGTFGHGLNRFDRRTGKFTSYRHNPADPASLSNDQVHRVFVDHAGTLWVGTDDGLDRMDPQTGRFKVYKPDVQSRLSPNYVSIEEDQSGKLWLGTHHNGVLRFDPATEKFQIYTSNPNAPGHLTDNMVPSIHMDRSGMIWVGTQNGLNRLDQKTNTFTSYDERDGLAGNVVSCILEDGQGSLWMSTNRGLSRFDPLKKTFKNYSVADGLPGNDLTGWAACAKSESGEMYFAGFPGAVAFRPESIEDSPYVPPLVLTDFRLGNRMKAGPARPLKTSISYATAITLSHDQNIFSLEFSALSYFSPATNRYRYKLESLDSEWHEVGSDQRVASYTTLPAGDYTFRVQGAVSRGLWSEPGASLRIDILPPYWNTWWFRAACAIFLLALLGLVYRLRLRQIAWQYNVRLEERVGERTRIARELHDTLLQSFQGSLIQMQAARNLFPRRPEQAVQTLDDAVTMAEGAIGESREAIQDLRSQPTDQGDLAQLLTVTAQDMARSQEANGNPVIFRVTVEGERQDLDPLLQDETYRIARQLLRNAFRHAHARHIEADIRYEDRLFRMRIRDDGKGIEPETLNGGGRAGHWGLLGMRERAKRIGAQLNFWSGPGSGTEVELSIPCSLAYGPSRRRSRFELLRKKKANS